MGPSFHICDRSTTIGRPLTPLSWDELPRAGDSRRGQDGDDRSWDVFVQVTALYAGGGQQSTPTGGAGASRSARCAVLAAAAVRPVPGRRWDTAGLWPGDVDIARVFRTARFLAQDGGFADFWRKGGTFDQVTAVPSVSGRDSRD
ncbi:hypothetical protein Nans01_47300 [Nocardiopsis ansamitocini]|uniref:Uncharacterized protein n=1 Tax=Nocardiopsis ansamitocini TaxID=1670832 RepID=A0A9W6PB80_9ACTN|nr:hypothetical protein Nans01_47300 [Nocardiopsis ansamitocini]